MSGGTPVRVIGTDSTWDVSPAGRAELDGSSVATCCITIDDIDGWALEHLEVYNAVDAGIGYTDADNLRSWDFIDCHSYNNDMGIGPVSGSSKLMLYALLVGCDIYNNTTAAMGQAYYSQLDLCSVRGNGNGIAAGTGTGVHACAVYANTGYGIRGLGGAIIVDQSVIDDNAVAGIWCGDSTIVQACRLTNNGTYGIQASSAFVLDLWNVYQGNASGNVTGSVISAGWQGGTARIDATADGYEDQAADKFTLNLGAEGYRQAMTMPDGLSVARFAAGLPTMPRVGVRG